MRRIRVLALLGLLASGCAVGSQRERGQDETGAPDEPPDVELQWSCPSSSPVVKQLALSLYTSYALLDDGSLWCWGRCWTHSTTGVVQLDETTTHPVRVHLDGVARVAAGDHWACAALVDGTVHCWGSSNLFGEVGPTPSAWTIDNPSHVAIDGVIDLSAGTNETCALRSDGTVACWGQPSEFFPEGFPLPADVSPDGPQPDPVEIPGIEPGGQQIQGGHHRHCVRRATGKLRCFGGNPNPDLSSETLPIRTFEAGCRQVCLADAAGEARCYFRGASNFGDPPVAISAWNGATELALDPHGAHACALTGGRARCAGGEPYANPWVPLTYIPASLPPVPGLFHSTHVAAGTWHGCAVDSGCVRCWGRNDEGQLGNGSYQSVSVPTFVRWE
jgi:hypothetical protein